jgi:hypothetical protein
MVEAPEIGGSDAPSGGYSGRRDEPVMSPGVLAGRRESGPDAGMRAGGEETEGVDTTVAHIAQVYDYWLGGRFL